MPASLLRCRRLGPLGLSVVGALVFLGWDVVQGAVQSAVVEPVDAFHRGVLDVVDDAQWAVWNGLPRRMASVLNKPIVVSANALSSASPTLPMDAAIPSCTSVSVNAIDVY
jgi:hypothetical protein